MKSKNFLQFIILMMIITISGISGCQSDKYKKTSNQYKPEHSPVVKWTANNDQLNFRYDFLENLETTTLFKATLETGTFAHHSHIIHFNGVLYATWDNHIQDENGSGQRGLLRRSLDQGKSWLPAEILFPSQDEMLPASEGYIGRRFQTSNGFVVIDNTLYALSDVADWTGQDIKSRHRVTIGRLCRSVNSDGTLGEIFWVLEKAPEPVAGFPAYPAGSPVLVKKINTYIKQPGHEIQLNFGRGIHPVSDDNHGLGEPVPSWKLDDQTLVRLYRDGGSKKAHSRMETEETKSRRNYAAFSFDNGKTWTAPTRTSFPDACARSNAGHLPDGQVYVINNMLPLSTKKGGRALLGISLSKDGLNFDRAAVIRFLPPPKKFDGRAKSVGYQYPHSVVVGNNLWVIYSVNKENIQVTKIPVSELYKLKST